MSELLSYFNLYVESIWFLYYCYLLYIFLNICRFFTECSKIVLSQIYQIVLGIGQIKLKRSLLKGIFMFAVNEQNIFLLPCRCLNPGMYAKHIERWLDYFPASQLIIIDGEELRNDPVYIMNDLQKFLEIEPFYNYTEHLR